jgi:DNA-binding transcriptional LysR family regulator
MHMKRGTLPLNALRAFEATARLGRMTDAAEALGVTYSAVSRQIRGLEVQLGVALFEGPRNRLRPSGAALQLLGPLTAAFDGIEEAVNRVIQDRRSVIDVSCSGTLMMRWLIPRLLGFQRAHPEIEVRLTANDGPVEFRRQRLDAAIRVGRPPWELPTAITLFEEQVGPVATPALVAAVAAPADLAALPRLHTRTRRDAWTHWGEAVGLALPGGGQEYEHFYFMLEAATAGLGVAIAPRVLVRDDLASGRLAAPLGFIDSGLAYVLLLPEDARPEARVFGTWLRDTAAAPSLPLARATI